jgi:histidinol-phosphate aminotransferase
MRGSTTEIREGKQEPMNTLTIPEELPTDLETPLPQPRASVPTRPAEILTSGAPPLPQPRTSVLTRPAEILTSGAPPLPQPRTSVLTMPEYHPPLSGRDALRLDFNENTFAPSPTVLKKLQSISAEALTTYPERAPVEHIVAAHLGLSPDQVLLTNGVDEAIHLIACAFLDAEDEALIFTPGFFMYDVSIALMAPGGLRKVQAGPTLAFDLERFLAAITPRTKLIIVASPNNPTGASVPREHLLRIAAAAPQAAVMVDEAYFHFHGETTLSDVATTPNLLVCRTFSKAYGLANLRVGMIAAPARLIRFLRKVSSPYNVNGIALAVLPEAIADEAYLTWYVEQIREGRSRIMAALDALGVPFFPSEANFVLMNIGHLHKEVVVAMRNHGVLLRDRSTDPGCTGFVRITVGIPAQVTQALTALTQSLTEIAWTPSRP